MSLFAIYYVVKCAKEKAEEPFMKRVSNHRHADRVVAATHHHHNMVQQVATYRVSWKHNVSLIIITTSLIFLGANINTIVYFQADMNATTELCTFLGLFEAVINAVYIVGRADLRFYVRTGCPGASKLQNNRSTVLQSTRASLAQLHPYCTTKNQKAIEMKTTHPKITH